MSSKRKQVYLAVGGSVAIHLAVLVAWALAVQSFPGVQAEPTPAPETIKLQVVEDQPAATPTPARELAAATPTPRPTIAYRDTEDLPEASQAPKNAPFQSDRNTEAASELPAAGDQPLPTQRGRKVPDFAFETHPFTPGDSGVTAGQNVPENMPPPSVAAASPPLRPAATPVPTATPAATVEDPRDLAMLTPKSIPSAPTDAEPNPYDPSFRPPVGMTEPPRPTPVPRRGGFRLAQERTDATGSISKTGAGSVDSEASPVGRYIVQVKRAVGTRYNQYVAAQADVTTYGSVRVSFTVSRDGKVLASRVVANSANEALAAVSLRSLTDAQIPPMPAEVVAAFEDGELHMNINFTVD